MSAKTEEITYNETLPDATEADAIEVANEESPSTGNETSDQLRQEIEETRAELTETIDALQDKLDPNRIKDRAIESTVGRVQEFAHTASEKIGPVAEKAVEAAKKLSEAATPAKAKAKEKFPALIETARNNPAIMAGVGVAAFVIGWAIRRRGRASASYLG